MMRFHASIFFSAPPKRRSRARISFCSTRVAGESCGRCVNRPRSDHARAHRAWRSYYCIYVCIYTISASFSFHHWHTHCIYIAAILSNLLSPFLNFTTWKFIVVLYTEINEKILFFSCSHFRRILQIKFVAIEIHTNNSFLTCAKFGFPTFDCINCNANITHI